MRKIKTEDHLTYLKVPVWNFSRVIHPFSKNRLYLKMPFFKFRKMRKKAKIAFWWAFRALEKIWFGLCNIKFKDMAWHMTTIKLCETLKSFFVAQNLNSIWIASTCRTLIFLIDLPTCTGTSHHVNTELGYSRKKLIQKFDRLVPRVI